MSDEARGGLECDECAGRGTVLDAPGRVLDGRSYLETCPKCQGTGRMGDLDTSRAAVEQRLNVIAGHFPHGNVYVAELARIVQALLDERDALRADLEHERHEKETVADAGQAMVRYLRDERDAALVAFDAIHGVPCVRVDAVPCGKCVYCLLKLVDAAEDTKARAQSVYREIGTVIAVLERKGDLSKDEQAQLYMLTRWQALLLRLT